MCDTRQNLIIVNDASLQEKQLLQYIRDLFEAGTATTSSTLNWGLLALVHHQDYQEKIAQEIDAVLGDLNTSNNRILPFH